MPSYTHQLRTQSKKFHDKGATLGASARPSTEAEKNQDVIEIEIENEVKRLLDQEQKKVNDTTTQVEKTYGEIGGAFQEFKVALEEFMLTKNTLDAGINQLLDKSKLGINALKRKRMDVEADWKLLRSINNIHREAEYPDNMLAFFTWIMALAFIELGLNFSFFQGGEGWISAFGFAAAIVILNLALSFGLGWGFRYKNILKPEWQRYSGWACLPIYILFTLFINGFFSRYRTEVALAKDLGGEPNVKNAISNVLPGIIDGSNFQNFNAFVIFSIGIIASIIAFYKGYTSSDEYPGYADQDRKLKKARSDEIAAIELLHSQIISECKKVQSEIKRNHDAPSIFVTQIGNHIASLEKCRDEFNRATSAINDDGNLLITAYRGANRFVRATVAPAYFDDAISFNFQPNLRDIDDYVSKFESLREAIEMVRVNSERHINEKKLEADTTEKAVFGDNIRNVKGAFEKWLALRDEDAKKAINAAKNMDVL